MRCSSTARRRPNHHGFLGARVEPPSRVLRPGQLRLRDRYFLTGCSGTTARPASRGTQMGAVPGGVGVVAHQRRALHARSRILGVAVARRLRSAGIRASPLFLVADAQSDLGARYRSAVCRCPASFPTRDANPTLKWEQTAQFNVALDYGS